MITNPKNVIPAMTIFEINAKIILSGSMVAKNHRKPDNTIAINKGKPNTFKKERNDLFNALCTRKKNPRKKLKQKAQIKP